MTPFIAGLSDELVKFANVLEKQLPATASYRSDTRHFNAPEPGGPQGSGGDLLGPDGKVRPDHEAPGDEPGPVKVAHSTARGALTGAAVPAALLHLGLPAAMALTEPDVRQGLRDLPSILANPGAHRQIFRNLSGGPILAGAALGWTINRMRKTANDPIQKVRVVQGLKCSLEWPKGTTRTYFSKSDPKKVTFKKLMKADYGYIPGTKDADGEQLDVYVGPNPQSPKVFTIRQLKDDGSFDENKVMLGYDSAEEAKKSYLDHMPPKRLGKITESTVDEFKEDHLIRARAHFRKAADVLNLFRPRAKKKAPSTQGHEDCPACSLADQVNEPSPTQSGAEAHL